MDTIDGLINRVADEFTKSSSNLIETVEFRRASTKMMKKIWNNAETREMIQ